MQIEHCVYADQSLYMCTLCIAITVHKQLPHCLPERRLQAAYSASGSLLLAVHAAYLLVHQHSWLFSHNRQNS